VLTLTPFYPTQTDDASGCFVSEPLVWLGKIGIHNTVIAVQPFYRARQRTNPTALTATWLRYFSSPGGFGLSTAGAFVFARIVGHVRQLHTARHIDLIHAHGPLPCGHAAMLLSRELDIPFAVSVHGLDAFSNVQVGGRAGEWCRRISRKVYAASRRVVCISEHVREAVLEGMGRNCRTSVVYNGVDLKHIAAEDSQDNPFAKADWAGASHIITCVANIRRVKGIDILVRTAQRVCRELPDAVGGGERISLGSSSV